MRWGPQGARKCRKIVLKIACGDLESGKMPSEKPEIEKSGFPEAEMSA